MSQLHGYSDGHALGSWLDDPREGNSSCYKPLYPTGDQWLPYILLSFLSHLHEQGVVGSYPKTSKNNLPLKGRFFPLTPTLQSNLPSMLFLPCYTINNYLPFFFFLSSSSILWQKIASLHQVFLFFFTIQYPRPQFRVQTNAV